MMKGRLGHWPETVEETSTFDTMKVSFAPSSNWVYDLDLSSTGTSYNLEELYIQTQFDLIFSSRTSFA